MTDTGKYFFFGSCFHPRITVIDFRHIYTGTVTDFIDIIYSFFLISVFHLVITFGEHQIHIGQSDDRKVDRSVGTVIDSTVHVTLCYEFSPEIELIILIDTDETIVFMGITLFFQENEFCIFRRIFHPAGIVCVGKNNRCFHTRVAIFVHFQ